MDPSFVSASETSSRYAPTASVSPVTDTDTPNTSFAVPSDAVSFWEKDQTPVVRSLSKT